MYKTAFLLSLLILSGCYKFRETNRLAIPPIAQDEIKTTNIEK